MGKTVWGGFSGPAKITYTLFGMLLGGFNSKKWSDGQRKKLFIINAVEAPILLKEDYHLLLRLRVPMGENSNFDKYGTKEGIFYETEKCRAGRLLRIY